jgi:phage I-like protein
MKSLITAAFASSLASIGGEPPAEIVYLPEGDHQITATVDGKPKTINVKVPAARGADIAQRLQSSLAERHSGNVRPHLAFQHQVGAASGIPKSFRYEPGKGIMCAVDWSGSGAAAIRNKDFSYFSPVFLLGDDDTPDGLPAKGELGSLVNEPAFRSMPRIAAGDATAAHRAGKPATATAQIEARAHSLVAAGEALTFDDAIDRVVASEPDLYKSSLGEKIRPEIQEEIEAMIAHLEPQALELLKNISDDLYLRGEAPTEADAMVRAIALNPHLFQQVQASDFEGKAKALVTAGDAKDIDEAFGMVAASDPQSYSDYLKSIS